MAKSKTIHTPEGTFIVDEDADLESFDLDSMLPEVPETPPPQLAEVRDGGVLVVNGEQYQGMLKHYTVVKNGITGKTIVKVVLVVAN